MSRIGFIGLGNMGLPMAKNLIAAGHELTAFDLAEAAVATARESGAEIAGSAADAARGVEAVITMLPAGKHVTAVYLGPDGVIAAADPGTLLIDCSTIDVETARKVAAEAAGAGFDMLDAPVSGGVIGAEAGTLAFMVGGPDAAFERARPVLDVMGANVIHAGGPGNGEAAKICNNMLLAISMIGVSEAFVLARRLGVDDRTLFEISSKSSGRCWSLDTYCPVPGPVPASPANRDYAPGFTTAMMLKDLNLARQAAEENGAETPLGAHAAVLYAAMDEAGHGGLDFSGIFKMLNGEI